MKTYVIEKKFEYKGFPCAVVLQYMGHRCGYVDIKGTRYAHKDYLTIPVEVHGGLTYGANGEDSVMGTNADEYWIGWDYAHFNDGRDFEALEEEFGDDEESMKSIRAFERICEERYYGHAYTAEEVEDDCKDVVEQIIRLEVKHDADSN